MYQDIIERLDQVSIETQLSSKRLFISDQIHSHYFCMNTV